MPVYFIINKKKKTVVQHNLLAMEYSNGMESIFIDRIIWMKQWIWKREKSLFV